MNDTTYEILLEARREFGKAIQEAHKKLNKVFGEKFKECCTITEIDERMQGWFGNLNKENCLSDYADQYRKKDGYWQECRCTKRLDFGENNGMLYDWFCDSLMMDRDFIAGTGGTASDDPRLDAYETIYQVPREILNDCKFYANNCIVVRVDGVDTLQQEIAAPHLRGFIQQIRGFIQFLPQVCNHSTQVLPPNLPHIARNPPKWTRVPHAPR